MCNWSLQRKGEGQKKNLTNEQQKIFQIDENYKHRDSKSKQKKHEENYAKAHHSPSAQNQ